MTRIAWGKVGARMFEGGVDRGVLYVEGLTGVPWNGLKSVNESSDGGSARPFYLDGYKYLNVASSEEFTATINAFSSPREFAQCEGVNELGNGLFVDNQTRKSFGFAYRTRVGNDVFGLDFGYKLHIVYNALAAPSNKDSVTVGSSISPMNLSWAITTKAPRLAGIKPTAHMVIDSLITPPNLMRIIEDILYGTDTLPPRLPSVEELSDLFKSNGQLLGVNLAKNPSFENGSGTVEVRRNLINNPRLILGTTSWLTRTGGGAEVSLVAAGGPPGGLIGERGWADDARYGIVTLTTAGSWWRAYTIIDSVTPNLPHTFSAFIHGNAGPINMRIMWRSAGGSTISESGTTTEIPANNWTLASHTAIAPENAVAAWVEIQRSETVVGTVLRFTGCLFEQTDRVRPFMDGAYSPDSDLTPSPIGTLHNSQSILTGVRVSNITTPPASQSLFPYQTGRMPVNGSFAARFAMQTTGPIAVTISDIVPPVGVPYTILLRVRANDRDMQVRPRIGGSTGNALVVIPVGQWVEFRLTNQAVSSTANGTGLFVNGAANRLIGETIDVDAVVITEGIYDGPAFDGSNVLVPNPELYTTVWLGEENNSISELYTWYY